MIPKKIKIKIRKIKNKKKPFLYLVNSTSTLNIYSYGTRWKKAIGNTLK